MRIAIGVAYDGAAFEGWQSQASRNTVQDRLEHALGEIASAPVRVVAAGRTDAGVHAVGQVAHFDTDVVRPETAWVRGANTHLPDSIAVQWAAELDVDFHARFSAISRSYAYVLYNHPVRPAVFAGRVGWFHLPLDLEAMRAAGARLVGEHDFSAFRSAECQAKSPVKTLHALSIERRADYVIFELTANAFLHHMVRNIVGCLVQVGKGGQPPEWVGRVLESRDRSRGAPTFAAAGLYLTAVGYPRRWSLPHCPPVLPWTIPLQPA